MIYSSRLSTLAVTCDSTVSYITRFARPQHCYNLGQADDRRGDAYMNALQPLLSVCPWIPIIGNRALTCICSCILAAVVENAFNLLHRFFFLIICYMLILCSFV